jgi:hypothetical protein
VPSAAALPADAPSTGRWIEGAPDCIRLTRNGCGTRPPWAPQSSSTSDLTRASAVQRLSAYWPRRFGACDVPRHADSVHGQFMYAPHPALEVAHLGLSSLHEEEAPATDSRIPHPPVDQYDTYRTNSYEHQGEISCSSAFFWAVAPRAH